MTRRRVWVTGLGAMSAAGEGTSALIDLLLEGRGAVRPAPQLCGRAAGQSPDAHADARTRRLDRAARFFFAAGMEAWNDAGLDRSMVDATRCAVIEGSSLGPLADALNTHAARLENPGEPARPSALVRFMPGAGSTALAHTLGLLGPVMHLSAGSVSAMLAIGEACQKISAGLIDLAIVGGAECPIHHEIAAHFDAAGILAPHDHVSACMPFDRRRCGTVLGEGAGVLVLESEKHAQRRGAYPRAIVRGFGAAGESHSLTAPDPTGAGVAAAARQATRGIEPGDIGWVKAHGTGTRLNDVAEARGLAAALGSQLKAAPITSLKSTLGHTLGASGALEAVCVALALRQCIIPATIGTEEPDPALPSCSVALRVERSRAKAALVVAEGFGGRSAALALERA